MIWVSACIERPITNQADTHPISFFFHSKGVRKVFLQSKRPINKKTPADIENMYAIKDFDEKSIITINGVAIEYMEANIQIAHFGILFGNDIIVNENVSINFSTMIEITMK